MELRGALEAPHAVERCQEGLLQWSQLAIHMDQDLIRGTDAFEVDLMIDIYRYIVL